MWNGRVWGSPGYLYPPTLALALEPLAGNAPLRRSVAVWFVVVGATVVHLVYTLSRLVGWPLALGAVVLFSPVWHTVWLGQVNAFIAACGAMALVGLAGGTSASAGVWLAAGGVIKITPVLGIGTLAVNGQWRSVRSAALVGMSVLLLSLLFVPLEWWIEGLTRALTRDFDSSQLASMTAWTARLPDPWGTYVTWSVAGVALAFTFWRARTIPPQFAVAAALLVTLLVARITWQHHAVIALPALALLWNQDRRGRALAAAAWVVISVLDGPSRVVGRGPYLLATPLVLSVCWIACCFPRRLNRPAGRRGDT